MYEFLLLLQDFNLIFHLITEFGKVFNLNLEESDFTLLGSKGVGYIVAICELGGLILVNSFVFGTCFFLLDTSFQDEALDREEDTNDREK